MVYSGQSLRKLILETSKIEAIVNLEGYSFDGVNVETIIITSEKIMSPENFINVFLNQGQQFFLSHIKSQEIFNKNKGFEFVIFADDVSKDLIEKLEKNSTVLDELVMIKAGLQAYEKGKGNPKQTENDVQIRPYDFNYKFDENTHKYLEGRDMNRYYVQWSGLYLQYGEQLAAPRTFDIFNEKNIIIREIAGTYPKSIIATYNEELFLFNRSNIAISERKDLIISLKYILAVLNSSLISYYFLKNTAKSVRKMFPKVILQDLRKFPVKALSFNEQQPFIKKAEEIISLNVDFQQLTSKFLRTLQRRFDLATPSRKLEAWHTLTFKDFIGELKKHKVILSIKDEMEWEGVFEEQRAAAQALQADIKNTDREIDALVYQLYGLTAAEIAIVEGT